MTFRLPALAVSLLLTAACAYDDPKPDRPETESGAPQPAAAASVTAYSNARVFDGDDFVKRDICTSAAVIVRCPANPENTVNLEGSFVTPPFGDAHTHHFDGPYTLEWHKSLALDSGTFYAMTMTAPTSGVGQIRAQLAGPGNVDVATSLGGLTGPDSHPAEIYEALALNIRSYEEQVARAEEIHAGRRYADDAYYVVEDKDDVVEKLGQLLSSQPDHVKVYLRHSERYAEGWGKWGPGGGIDPSLLRPIRNLVTDAGKRLAVATSSVNDFRVSLDAAADIVTHLPCYQDTESDKASVYYDVATAEECLISVEDAEAAAGIKMAGTLITTEWEKDRPAKLVDWERQNVAKLRAAGVTLVVATNNYGSTLTEGLIAGVQKGYFSSREMLRMATMDTPRFIFPKRQVGCLDAGCDASFIAFTENPLENFAAIRSISLRLKDGQPL